MKLNGHKTDSVYRRYDIVDEQDLRDGVERLAKGFGHHLAAPGQKDASPEVAEAEVEYRQDVAATALTNQVPGAGIEPASRYRQGILSPAKHVTQRITNTEKTVKRKRESPFLRGFSFFRLPFCPAALPSCTDALTLSTVTPVGTPATGFSPRKPCWRKRGVASNCSENRWAKFRYLGSRNTTLSRHPELRLPSSQPDRSRRFASCCTNFY